MGSLIEMYLDRANNEIMAAGSLKRLSEQEEDKISFDLPGDISFYSSVILHSYYAIFYAAKAILLTKDIETKSPEVHKKTFAEFKENFVDTKELDVSFLKIYRKMIVRADELLEIFRDEKWKRGHFTYQTIPQANKGPAEDSLKNSKFFVSNIMKVIGER
ncbi:HEPN domain-containing protein [Candidatus Woesearchaeota archaeon]|nr:HEPN domain-containing protein [Candidatus Woesearchaeota archaeon]